MKLNGSNTAFAKLLEYEKRSETFSASTRHGSGPAQEWSGVTFGMGESKLACNIDRVHEILPLPQIHTRARRQALDYWPGKCARFSIDDS